MPKSTKQQDEQNEPFVYVPHDTVVNIGNDNSPPPITQYEKRKWKLDRGAVKNLVGGIFGIQRDNS